MHLVQLLLPLYDNAGQPLARTLYADLARELTARFGGLTAHTRAPAEGLWREGAAETVRDDIVIYEVMTESLDDGWWAALRARLERDFRQEAVVIRAQEVRLL